MAADRPEASSRYASGLTADTQQVHRTGEAGYHPVRKIKVVLTGLIFAVRHDVAVAYKVIVSVVLVAVAAALQQWVDLR